MAKSGSFNFAWESGTWSAGNRKWYHCAGTWTRGETWVSLTGVSFWVTTQNSSYGTMNDTGVRVTGGAGRNTSLTINYGYESNHVALADGGFGVSTSQTSATIYCYVDSEATGSQGISFDAWNTPPTGLNVSNVSATKDTITGTVSISGWGVGANSDRHLEFNVSSDKTTNNRRYQPGTKGDTSTSKSLTCSNSSAGNITLTPNSMYYIGAYATNGSANTGVKWDWGTKVTLPDDLSAKSATAVDTHTIKIDYTTKADGNKYAKKIQYSLDNSTWVDGATVSSGSATSGNFNITELNPGTQYTIYLRVHTDAGDTTSGSITVMTKSACKIIRGDTVIEAIPKIIKPNGDIIEAKITRI